MGFLAGAGLTDHDQPAEGGREEAEDGSGMDEPGIWRRQEDEGAP